MTTPMTTPAGWYPDPSLRHEFRYWDGAGWSAHVSDHGQQSSDPELRPSTTASVAQRLQFHIASRSWNEVTELGRAEPQVLVERFLAEAQRHPGEQLGVSGISLGGELGELRTPPEGDVRTSLVSALRDVGEPVVGPLLSGLDSADADTSSYASWALVEIGEAALDPLLARSMPTWTEGSFNTSDLATVAFAAKRSRERGGQGFVAHLALRWQEGPQAGSVLQVTRLVAGLAGEDVEYAAWLDDLINRALDEGPDACVGVGFTLGLPQEALAHQIAADVEVLRSTLEQLPDFNARLLLRALERGRSISREVSREPSGSGFTVRVTLLAGAAKDAMPDQATHPESARPAGGPSIVLRAADEQTAHNLTTDPHFLAGALTEDRSSQARAFLAALAEGPAMTHEVASDPDGSGFIVTLTIEQPEQVQPVTGGPGATVEPGLPAGQAQAGWFPDPTRRHQHRYWDGARWTEHAADQGVVSIDALPG